MVKIAVICNWVCVAIYAIGIVGLYRLNPNRPEIWLFVSLLPYLAALLALRVGTQAIARYFAAGINALFVSINLIVVTVAATGRTDLKIVFVPLLIIFSLAPTTLNAFVLLRYRVVSIEPAQYEQQS